jgi:hypothetical protein
MGIISNPIATKRPSRRSPPTQAVTVAVTVTVSFSVVVVVKVSVTVKIWLVSIGTTTRGPLDVADGTGEGSAGDERGAVGAAVGFGGVLGAIEDAEGASALDDGRVGGDAEGPSELAGGCRVG